MNRARCSAIERIDRAFRRCSSAVLLWLRQRSCRRHTVSKREAGCAPVASEMSAPRMNTRVEIARLSIDDDTADAMKSSVPSTCITEPMVQASTSTMVVDTSCLMPSIHASSDSALVRITQVIRVSRAQGQAAV